MSMEDCTYSFFLSFCLSFLPLLILASATSRDEHRQRLTATMTSKREVGEVSGPVNLAMSVKCTLPYVIQFGGCGASPARPASGPAGVRSLAKLRYRTVPSSGGLSYLLSLSR